MSEKLLNDICSALSDAGLRVSKSYPKAKLDRTAELVCVSISEEKLIPTAMGAYLGTALVSGVKSEVYGCTASCALSLDIYAPAAGSGAARCMELADEISSKLTDMGKSLGVLGFKCGDTGYDSESGMFRCRCTLSCAELRTKAEPEPTGSFDDFILKGELK